MSVSWNDGAYKTKIHKAAMEALHVAGELVLKDWAETIPYATGDLASHLTVTDQPSENSVIISSTGPYAIRQELDESLRHPDPTNPASRSGRKAHAGRDALNKNRENITKLVEARIG